LRNTTGASITWTAKARENAPNKQTSWAQLTPSTGSVPPGKTATISVKQDPGLCTPGDPNATTDHVDVTYNGNLISVAVTVTPQT
jgi:hypothetical protein